MVSSPVAAIGQHLGHRLDVSLGQVVDVDVVTDARPVRSVVVVAEDVQMGPHTGSYLCDDPHQTLVTCPYLACSPERYKASDCWECCSGLHRSGPTNVRRPG